MHVMVCAANDVLYDMSRILTNKFHVIHCKAWYHIQRNCRQNPSTRTNFKQDLICLFRSVRLIRTAGPSGRDAKIKIDLAPLGEIGMRFGSTHHRVSNGDLQTRNLLVFNRATVVLSSQSASNIFLLTDYLIKDTRPTFWITQCRLCFKYGSTIDGSRFLSFSFPSLSPRAPVSGMVPVTSLFFSLWA